jgi:hypothetical protein
MSNKHTNVYLDAKTSFLEPSIQQYGGHMVMTNVKRHTRQKYVNIDTRFSDDYIYDHTTFNQTASYTLTLPERLKDVKSIRVLSAEIPISFYNFSAALGNTSMKLTDASNGTKMVVIKDGFYSTSAALKTEIVSKITALGSTYTNINFDISSNSYSSLDCSASSFQVKFDTDISGNTDKYNFRSKLGWALGFRNQTYGITTTKTYSESMVNLNTVRYLYLVVDEFSSGMTNSFICPLQDHLMNKKILARIAVDTVLFPFGSVQPSTIFNGRLISDERMYNGTVDIQKINIQIVNEYGIPVNFNGMDFSFILDVTYE